ncbi:hypothetical protein Val02_18020 [Virgisporangium aliadipatigenens]|uniref:Sensor-like histidine kinase SenX3 n=2 Tax=Virgisporangium aliadipatigenens TaxID=741659 RepID=A0A8J3YJ71_9ACTN|nr:hypothetical protein Val02_18020 [Virgisporangium aliadipatigenens]
MRSAAALTVAVTLTGVLVSVGIGFVLERRERASAAEQLDRRAAIVAETVAAEAGRYVDTLDTLAGAIGAFELSADAFKQVTAPLERMGLAGASSIAYLVPGTDADVPRIQQYWRGRGATDLQLRPQNGHGEHIFSIFSRSLDGQAMPPVGGDIVAIAAPTQALLEARRGARVTVSDTYRLVRDNNVPESARQMSFVLTAPVFGRTDAAGQRPFLGWVLMGLRGQDFIGTTLERASRGLLNVTLRARDSDDALARVATLRTTGAVGNLRREIEVSVAQRRWYLDVDTDAATLPGGTSRVPWAAALAGAALSALVGALVFILATRRARAEQRVRAATARIADGEAQAREQAALLQAVLDSISDGVGVVDADGELMLVNPAAERILGRIIDAEGPDAWQSHFGLRTREGEPFPAAALPLFRALHGESVDNVEVLLGNHAAPDEIHVSVSARPLHPDAGRQGAVAVIRDVTERKRQDLVLASAATRLGNELSRRAMTEAQLRQTRDELAGREAYLADVIDAVDVAIVLYDARGRIVRTNRTAREMAGDVSHTPDPAEAARLVNATTLDGRPLPASDTAQVRIALAGGQADDLEVVISPPGYPRRVLQVSTRPLRGADGAVIGAVSSCSDVTALRDQQAELAAFAGVVAHDLKAPLAGVGGYAELIDEELQSGEADPAVLQPLLKRVCTGVARMGGLIDDLLDYATARDASINATAVDLRSVLDEVVPVVLAGSRTDDRPDIYIGPLPPVHADPAMLRQLMHNLLGNAVKYTPPGRTARVDITAGPDEGDGMVHLRVADRGIGIPEGQHEAIFHTFHRAHRDAAFPGTGLGLAICQRIVHRHGGTIAASDNPGGGARFELTLPAALATAPGREVRPSDPARPADRRTPTG